ncbi:hypothetical protein PIROE2DRAFT_3020 [Piromyces sp. E2]|nr:hypothetical protein PIROE2DRAFT_3020 [Piromyces sp. E2]|eukprot:OUM69126.1 hypothetical protein PIROE2DRAFT_3020 [Piromyces sp. E2]
MFKTKNIFLITLLTLCLSIGMVHCEFGKSLHYARAPNGEEIICIYRFGIVESCYPRVFKATAEYQTILEGQEIPKGLDIQISMRTGERRAKLSDAMIQQQKIQQLQEYLKQQTQQEREEEQRRKIQTQKRIDEYLQRKAKQQQIDEYLQRRAAQQQYEEYLEFQAQKRRFDEYLQRRAAQQQYEEYLQRQAQQQQYEEYLEEQLHKQKYREYLQQQAKKQQYEKYLKEQQEIEKQKYEKYVEEQEQLQKQKYDEYLKEEAKRQQQHEEYLRQLLNKPEIETPEVNPEDKNVHEIVMVKPEEGENGEETKTQTKVQIHSGKYKSSESPHVNSPENNSTEKEDKDSSSDSDDNEDDNVVKIHYEDKVSYTEAFGSLFKANTLEEKIEVLEQLEDIVHHIEFGQELMKSLPEFLKFLKDENPKVRALASICVGSALQNNPKARKTAIKQNLYETLIDRLTNEEEITVLKRLCYAFSNLVRGDTRMIKKLHQSKNLGLLYHLYVNKPALRSKLETFITDVYDPEKMKEGTKLEEFVDKESAQLWCTIFQNNIISNEGYIPDSLNSLSIILEAGQCLSINNDLRHVLKDLPKTQPELFEETLDLNNNIQKILNYQGPQQPQTFKEL